MLCADAAALWTQDVPGVLSQPTGHSRQSARVHHLSAGEPLRRYDHTPPHRWRLCLTLCPPVANVDGSASPIPVVSVTPPLVDPAAGVDDDLAARIARIRNNNKK